MNRSLLVMSVCILLLTGVCVLAAQEEKKSPPPPTNQPDTKRLGEIIGKQAVAPENPAAPKKQPPPPANQPGPKGPPGPPANAEGPKKPLIVYAQVNSDPLRPGHACVGITAVVKGSAGTESVTLYRAWDDGVIEMSTKTTTSSTASKWQNYSALIPTKNP